MRDNKENRVPSDRLPDRLPASMRRERVRTALFPGLRARGPRFGARASDEDGVAAVIAAMENLSPRAYPALAVRRPRELLVGVPKQGKPHGMAVMNGCLYFVQGGTLYRTDGGIGTAVAAGGAPLTAHAVGNVADSDKQMAVFGDRLLIFPDKLYVDAAEGLLRPMELDTGLIPLISFVGNTITLPEGYRWTDLGFFPGDGIRVVNHDDVTPAPEGNYCIKSLHGRVATLTGQLPGPYDSTAAILRPIPDLSHLCVSGNRVYGCHKKDIRISAEGSAFCWIPYNSAGSFDGGSGASLRADTEGDFTACTPWQGYVVFFKADRICRLLGSRADSFTLSDALSPGIPATLSNTLCEVGGALYYHGDAGIFRYGSGNTVPERVGCLSEVATTDGCGGSDGACYYLSRTEISDDGMPHSRTALYTPEGDAWFCEDARPMAHMVTMEGCLCCQDAVGNIWLTRSDGRRMGMAVDETDFYGPIHASVTFAPDHSFETDGRRPTAVSLRAGGEPGAELRVLDVHTDPTDPTLYVELGAFTGGRPDSLLDVRFLPVAADGMTLRLEMIGEWRVDALIREYEIGR